MRQTEVIQSITTSTLKRKLLTPIQVKPPLNQEDIITL